MNVASLPREQTILLAGATGYIGRAIAAELVRRGSRVVAVVRTPAADLPGCELLAAEVTDADALVGALDGMHADAMPSTGAETLRDFHARVLDEGLDGQALGEYRVFGSRRER